jgi:triosephosphate isomerase
MKPIIVVNLKTYKNSTGKNALKIVKSIEKGVRDSNQVVICAQAGDIHELAGKTKLDIYSQHVDYFEQGRNTGFIIIEDVISAGAKGTLLNHSEHLIDFDCLKKTIERCKKKKFKTIVCVKSRGEADKIIKLQPDMIALEVPELIESGKAISEFKPDSVKKFSETVRRYNRKHNLKIKPLCGAGISDEDDVRAAIELGCRGVLSASAVVKSKNPGILVKKMSKENA